MPSLIRKRELTQRRLETLRAAYARWLVADDDFGRADGNAREHAAAVALDAQGCLARVMLACGVGDRDELETLLRGDL